MITFVVYPIIFAALALFSVIFLLRYKRCPSNKILAVYGKVSGDKSVKCYHGGAKFIWPFIQDYAFLDLTPRTIHIPLKNALSLQNIRINVPSTFTVGIDTSAESMHNAAVRLLGLSAAEIELMAIEIITGQMRLTVASLTIEQINLDRELFQEAIRSHIDPELKKIGLYLINVNITDITDESHYIESIGKKAAALAVNNAKIDVAEADKRGEIGKSDADQLRQVSVANNQALAVLGENEASAKIAQYNAQLDQKIAEAEMNSQIAQQNAIQNVQHAKALAEMKRLEAEAIVPQEIARRKIMIEAEALSQKLKTEAEGQANALLAMKQAEAAGMNLVLEAKALGYAKIIKACNDDPQAAANMLLVEKLETIASLQAEAIKNIKIDKITVWDSGNSEKGSSTAQFMSSMVKSLPALHDIASMAGIDLPQFLGSEKNDITK